MKTITSTPKDFGDWMRNQKPNHPVVPTTEDELRKTWRRYKDQADPAIRDAQQIVRDASGKRNVEQDIALDVAARQLERDFHEWLGRGTGKTADQVKKELNDADLGYVEDWYDDLLDTVDPTLRDHPKDRPEDNLT